VLLSIQEKHKSEMEALKLSIQEKHKSEMEAQKLSIQKKHKSELETLKSTHATSLASQAADFEMYKLQMDNDGIRIEQLKRALDSYQQREVRCMETFAADFAN